MNEDTQNACGEFRFNFEIPFRNEIVLLKVSKILHSCESSTLCELMTQGPMNDNV